MNKPLVVGLCVFLAFAGFKITTSEHTVYIPSNTVQAAKVLDWKINSTIQGRQTPVLSDIKPDTVFIKDTVRVTNTKYVRVKEPESTTDTVFIPILLVDEPAVSNQNPDTVKSSVVLTIDGTTVYSTDEPLKL